jgi:hypothetical protein
MQAFKSWALLTVAGSSGLAIAAFTTWFLLEWFTGPSRPRSGMAMLVGSALGAGFTVAGAFWVTRWSAERSVHQRHGQLVRQIEEMAADAAQLDTRAHPDNLSDEEAGRLSRILARDCETLREALGVLDFTMRGRVDESYDVLAALFKVRRSLETLNKPKARDGQSRIDEYRKGFEEVGEDSLNFQITLRGVSSDTDELRMRLATLLETLRSGPR